MPLPKLSPLQSRLAASLIASLMLLMLYFAFSNPHFAYAADVDSIRPEDHNHERLLDTSFLESIFGVTDDELEHEESYQAEFLGFERGIMGRAPTGKEPTELMNNRIVLTNLERGQTLNFMFSNKSLFGDLSPKTPGLPSQLPVRGRSLIVERDAQNEDENEEPKLRMPQQSSSARNRTLYITVTACDQPRPIANTTTEPPPQLKLYVSQSQNNTKPGPSGDISKQVIVELNGGYALYTLNATGDVFFGVYGENVTDYDLVWSIQVAASIDAPFHVWHNTTQQNLFVVDSDSTSALLVTPELMQKGENNTVNATLFDQWMSINPPYTMFARDVTDKSIMGMENSYCAWEKKPTNNVQTGITIRGIQKLPKQQFHITGMTPGSQYNVVLAMHGNSTARGDGVVRGGGQVYPMSSFATLSGGNCGLVFNLSFCSETAYAVPSNPNTFPNMTSLAAFYDNYTLAYYNNFKKVLAQIPCETTASAQYSLVKTCTDCDNAYKSWLCSVTIPRCTDFTSDKPWLVPRAMGQPFPNGTLLSPTEINSINGSAARNNSRNPIIDEGVAPGPYKEVLPCDELCYEVVRSCPARIGFDCPQPGMIGFDQSYGVMPRKEEGEKDKELIATCNYPGLVDFNSRAGKLGIGVGCFPVIVLAMIMVMGGL